MNIDVCAAMAIADLPEHVRATFAAEPLSALRAVGLTVEAVEELAASRSEGGVCDGWSYLDDDVVLYAPSPNSRRENFTLGHELGHYLVDSNDKLLDWLADQPDAMRQLETVCDRIAQRLLLPDEIVLATLRTGDVEASTLLQLYDTTQASRPAIAIAMAARLRHLGAVTLMDPVARVVAFSSVHPDAEHGWPEVFPWTGHPIPAGHPLRTLRAGGEWTGRSYWETPWGRREQFYVDAIHDGRRIVAVFSERDLWHSEVFHAEPDRDYLERPMRTVTCCGATSEVRGFPCPSCDGGYCPTCNRCRCQKADDDAQLCGGCFMLFMPHLLQDGRCEECR